ncbi:transposase [Belnapia sp. T18]|uniref:Transposase n=1 Tax=Belnapia arida TaxID=2804533 RepID=A0ABS1UCY2_9PROT|nr:transposase [Belnapia arida]
MARKHHKPEEIVAKLRQVEVLLAQGKTAAEPVRTIGVTEQSYYRWRSEYGGLKLDEVMRLEQLEQENGRRHRQVERTWRAGPRQVGSRNELTSRQASLCRLPFPG